MKPAVHFHSDCPFFAGCENMLATLLNDDCLRQEFEFSVSYRYTEEYEKGFRARIAQGLETFPLRLLDLEAQLRRISNRPLRIFGRLLAHILLLKYVYIFLNKRTLEAVFKGKPIRILHINNGGYPGAYSCMAAVLAARNARISDIVYVVNNIAEGYGGVQRWFDRPLDAIIARTVSRFVTGSSAAGIRLAEIIKLDRRKIACIHNGIRLRTTTESVDNARRRLGIHSLDFVVGVVAVLERRKGHRVLCDAARLIKERFGLSSVPCILIEGVGSERRALEELIKDSGIASKVRFVGHEENIFNFMNCVDIMVLPSLSHEDFPNTILEGMSLGKPVIASRISGTPEQVEDGITGVLVPPGDPESLAAALMCLAGDESLRIKMGKAAQQRFNEYFTASEAVKRYRDLYCELMRSA